MSVKKKRKYIFKTKPYKHQKDAMDMAGDRTAFAFFMEMGTGKSKTLLDNLGTLAVEDKCHATGSPKRYLNIYLKTSRTEQFVGLPVQTKSRRRKCSQSKMTLMGSQSS